MVLLRGFALQLEEMEAEGLHVTEEI